MTGAPDAPPETAPLAAPARQAPPERRAAAAPAPVFSADAPRAAPRPGTAAPLPPNRSALRGGDEDEPGELVEFSPNTSLMLRRIGTPGVTGGLLQSNPHLEKRERRQLGLALRF